jgi:hypothetical protein
VERRVRSFDDFFPQIAQMFADEELDALNGTGSSDWRAVTANALKNSWPEAFAIVAWGIAPGTREGEGIVWPKAIITRPCPM